MEEPNAPPPPATAVHAAYVGDDGRLCADLRCIGCHYNLRGTQADSVCPECGRAVVDAFNTLALTADPTWMERIRLGGMCIMLGLPVRVIAAALFVFGQAVSCNGVIEWLMYSVLNFGAFLYASPNPAAVGKRERYHSIVIRTACVAEHVAVAIFVIEATGYYYLGFGWVIVLPLVSTMLIYLAGILVLFLKRRKQW